MDHIVTRFFFSSLDGAVEALLLVLEDAKETDKNYSFGSLSSRQVLASGLMLIGDASDIASKLEMISGAQRHDE